MYTSYQIPDTTVALQAYYPQYTGTAPEDLPVNDRTSPATFDGKPFCGVKNTLKSFRMIPEISTAAKQTFRVVPTSKPLTTTQDVTEQTGSNQIPENFPAKSRLTATACHQINSPGS
jgi:hypothetical protein